MNDIVKRLRLSQRGAVKLHVSHYQKDCGDAADEIERLTAALAHQSEGRAMEQRALQIIADEERYAQNDPPGNINIYAMRMLRVGTAKQILGLLHMTDLPATEAVLAAAASPPPQAPQAKGDSDASL